MKDIHYSTYLQLDKILAAQFPESNKNEQPAHDEMLFIIIHQSYELWFKQIMHEVNSIIGIMQKPSLNDNSPELQTVVHRLRRIATILKVLVQQVDIMETMTAMDFLDFRDMLRPASGFQSWQFKGMEAKLGLKYEHRHGQEYYVSQLRPEEVEMIKEAEKQTTLLELVNAWLERMPFFDDPSNWKNFTSVHHQEGIPLYWANYRECYRESLVLAEETNLRLFDNIFLNAEGDTTRSLSARASRAALFIMLYRGYPLLHQPFQLLNELLEIDEQLSNWRYRHMNMVHRMIGTRVGTGGSTGKEYLRSAADKHYIFRELSQLTSFLIERRKLPVLPIEMEEQLGFVHR
jgi:tryptophan 2,3-dioxygenase